MRVDHFDEADVLSRPQFARVAADFKNSGTVSPDVLVEATVEYLRSAMAEGVDVVVCDALMPYVPSLLAWGYAEDDIASTVKRLAEQTVDVSVLAVFVDGSPEAALERAAAREGDGWLAWYGAKLARCHLVPPQPSMADLVAYLVYERDVTLRVLNASPWRVAVVEDAIGPGSVAVRESVLGHLDP
jgi:hypothetical protein